MNKKIAVLATAALIALAIPSGLATSEAPAAPDAKIPNAMTDITVLPPGHVLAKTIDFTTNTLNVEAVPEDAFLVKTAGGPAEPHCLMLDNDFRWAHARVGGQLNVRGSLPPPLDDLPNPPATGNCDPPSSEERFTTGLGSTTIIRSGGHDYSDTAALYVDYVTYSAIYVYCEQQPLEAWVGPVTDPLIQTECTYDDTGNWMWPGTTPPEEWTGWTARIGAEWGDQGWGYLEVSFVE